jgi:hypothetical protein
MALQYSAALRSAQLDQIEATIGDGVGTANPVLQIFTAGAPASCASPDNGSMIVEITLPDDWMAAAANGSVSKSAAAWVGTATLPGTNVPGHFRIKNSAKTVCHMQGTTSGVGGGGDMSLIDTTITEGDAVRVESFTITAGNS